MRSGVHVCELTHNAASGALEQSAFGIDITQ